MKTALVLSVILAIACLTSLLLGARAQTALHVWATLDSTGSDQVNTWTLLEKAETYSAYSTHILMGTVPFFGVLIGQIYRLYRKQKK